MTLQTIADRVGVSRMTVSNAFSRPDQLSAELRGRILAAAEEIGYVGPDPAARALARGTVGAVGVLLTDSLRDAFSDEVATMFLGAIAEGLAPTGRALTLLTSSARNDLIPARDVPLDGAVVYSCDQDSVGLGWLLRRKLPLVYVDQEPRAGVDSVNIDDRSGARAAAQHVVDLGHRRVGIVTSGYSSAFGPVDDPVAAAVGFVAKARMVGWLEPLTAAGIHPTVMQGGHPDQTNGYAGGAQLLAGEPRPTAILCFTRSATKPGNCSSGHGVMPSASSSCQLVLQLMRSS